MTGCIEPVTFLTFIGGATPAVSTAARRVGIESALLGLGRASTADLTPEDVLVPPGFAQALGAAEPVSFRG